MSILGEIFGAIMQERMKKHLSRTSLRSSSRDDGFNMVGLLGMLQELQTKQEDINLCTDEAGYDDFIKASDAEYEERNFKKARECYQRACDKGHPMAMTNFALWFLEGSRPGCPKNHKRAFRMFEQAAEKKIGMAMYNLAHFYYTGKSGVVALDYERAYHLARESIKDERVTQMRQGEPFYLLGTMLISGKGCMKNTMKAKKYFEKAGEFGHTGATPEMLKMVNLLTQCDPMESQRESDRRWDRMCAYQDEHPEEKPETMGEHLTFMRKFGFDIGRELSEREKRIKGGFDKFLEVTGGALQMMDAYEMEDEPLPTKKCGRCKKPDAKRRCAKCGEPYCSRPCQKADWQAHKKICQMVQAAQS